MSTPYAMTSRRWSRLRSVLRLSSRQGGTASKLVVGLGNPGAEYAGTRHNVGFWCVDHLAKASSITLSRRHRLVVVGEGVVSGVPVALAKPRTFVNNSGRAITSLLARYKAAPSDLLVVYDDMALPVGRMRVRARGSSGGHNGMKSIIEATGTQNFARVRIGIGRPEGRVDEVEHVLGRLSREEQHAVEGAVERAAEAVVCALAEGIEVAMNRFN